MEIKVGEYVRTKKGKIFQYCKGRAYLGKDNAIVKHSKNIIDLIELYDYVNGMVVFDIITYDNGEKAIKISSGYLMNEKEIKDILTHEQYQANCYEIDTN